MGLNMDTLKFLLLSLLCTIVFSEDVEPINYSLIKSTNKFAINLFKEVVSHEEAQNLLISPLSSYLALALTSDGAAGKTYEQLRDVLSLPDQLTAQVAFQNLINESNVHEDIELSVASRLYLLDRLDVNPEFEVNAKNKFNSSVIKFHQGHVQETLDSINKWVNESTHGKISDIVTPDEVNDALMLLLNAVYFKADWKKCFNETLTKPKQFNITHQDRKVVQMMHLESNFFTGKLKKHKGKFIQLPYKNEDFKMTVILPPKTSSLSEFVKSITSSILEDIKDSGNISQIQLIMPKFKIESSVSLDKSLKKLGLTDMFDPDLANFTNLVKPDELFSVTEVKQKAFIDVNEKGSEATAVSIVKSLARMYRPVDKFKVNRPCVFLISKNDVILFMGYLKNPEY